MEKYLKEVDLSERWGISVRTIQRWRWKGKGPAYLKLGGRVVYRLCDVEAWEASNRKPGDEDAKLGVSP
jgi:hypothetical protein